MSRLLFWCGRPSPVRWRIGPRTSARESRPARGAGRGARRHVEGEEHGCPSEQICARRVQDTNARAAPARAQSRLGLCRLAGNRAPRLRPVLRLSPGSLRLSRGCIRTLKRTNDRTRSDSWSRSTTNPRGTSRTMKRAVLIIAVTAALGVTTSLAGAAGGARLAPVLTLLGPSTCTRALARSSEPSPEAASGRSSTRSRIWSRGNRPPGLTGEGAARPLSRVSGASRDSGAVPARGLRRASRFRRALLARRGGGVG
jgi:hypothetical protein